MKILFLASWFPNRINPTDGNFVAKHARLVANIHAVEVIHVQPDPDLASGKEELLQTRQDGYGLTTVYFGQQPDTSRWRKISYRRNAYESALSNLKNTWGAPDLIHAHVLLDAGMMGRFWSQRLKVPLVITEHSTAYHLPGALSGLRKLLGKRACRKAAFILPVSKHLGRSMRELNGLEGNYRQVSNVVNTGLFRYVPPPPTKTFRFLHVSNFNDEHKNITGLLNAFYQLVSRTGKTVHLHLAGDGNPDELRERIKTAGLSKWEVSVTGPHTEAEIAGLLQKCHAFVLPSHYENEPVVLLEAQSCGRPCIATRTGGIPEILAEPHCGELVDVGDEEGLVIALLKVVDNYGDYDQKKNRQLAVNRCSERAILDKLSEVYLTSLK